MRRSLTLTIVGALISLLTGCAGGGDGGHSAPGHLVIVGGALRADNEGVLGRFAQLAGTEGDVGILPTASGVPERSARATGEDLGRYLDGERVRVIDLTTQNADEADDPDVADAIASCGALWFTGGDQNRIITVFRPGRRDTPAYAAVMAVLQRGGVVGGTSAGAAMMSDPMIGGGRSEASLAALLGGATEPEGVRVGPGMGLVHGVITDQHFLARGRMGRLISALVWTDTPIGCGIDENCALIVDRTTLTAEAHGDEGGLGAGVVIVDTSNSLLTLGRLENVRVSILGEGDSVNLATGRIIHAGRTERAARAPLDAGGVVDLGSADTFHHDGLGRVVDQLRSGASVTAHAGSLALVWSGDARTRFRPEAGAATGLRLDLSLRLPANEDGARAATLPLQ